MLPQEEQGHQLAPGDAGVSGDTAHQPPRAGQVPTQQRTTTSRREGVRLGSLAYLPHPEHRPDSGSSLLSLKFRGLIPPLCSFLELLMVLQVLCISVHMLAPACWFLLTDRASSLHFALCSGQWGFSDLRFLFLCSAHRLPVNSVIWAN